MSIYRGWIGIDPGVTGALVRVYESGQVVVRDTPTVTVEVAGKTRTQYDPPQMWAALQALVGDEPPAELLIVLELVRAGVFGMGANGQPQKMGATSAFGFGEGVGIWRDLICALGCPILRPAPQTWKAKLMRDMPKEKEAALVAAGNLYPTATSLLRTPRGRALHGRADAILLAHFGRTNA
jgi:hypothetical protein